MKLYVKGYSSYRSDEEEIDRKKELKQKYKLDTRRQDSFVHLALLGAQRLKETTDINTTDELYITSGIGNIEIIQKIYKSVKIEKELIRPFDFINVLGNTTSYYVASSLNLKNKNIFQISDNFTFINTLISIYASLYNSNKEAILGSVDLLSSPKSISNNLLGVDEDSQIISSSSYQKFSFNKENTIATIEFETKIYTLDEIKEYLTTVDKKIIFSPRCKEFQTKNKIFFSETIISNIINQHIKEKIDFFYIDSFEDKYKILNLHTNTI